MVKQLRKYITRNVTIHSVSQTALWKSHGHLGRRYFLCS